MTSRNAALDHEASADTGLIDEFCDTVWLEDGLSKNTIEAYRRVL